MMLSHSQQLHTTSSSQDSFDFTDSNSDVIVGGSYTFCKNGKEVHLIYGGLIV